MCKQNEAQCFHTSVPLKVHAHSPSLVISSADIWGIKAPQLTCCFINSKELFIKTTGTKGSL